MAIYLLIIEKNEDRDSLQNTPATARRADTSSTSRRAKTRWNPSHRENMLHAPICPTSRSHRPHRRLSPTAGSVVSEAIKHVRRNDVLDDGAREERVLAELLEEQEHTDDVTGQLLRSRVAGGGRGNRIAHVLRRQRSNGWKSTDQRRTCEHNSERREEKRVILIENDQPIDRSIDRGAPDRERTRIGRCTTRETV